jgi:hypothetical protein
MLKEISNPPAVINITSNPLVLELISGLIVISNLCRVIDIFVIVPLPH